MKSLDEMGLSSNYLFDKRGLPKKFDGSPDLSYENVVRLLKTKDLLDFVNRGKWKDLPTAIGSRRLEAMLYKRGSLIFFKEKQTEKYYFMPYVGEGSLDFYNRWNYGHPIPLVENNKEQERLLSTMHFKLIYEETQLKDIQEGEDVAVVLFDYCEGEDNTINPRSDLQNEIICQEAEMYAFARTAGLNATGIKQVEINDSDQNIVVETANNSLRKAARKGKGFVGVSGVVKPMELKSDNAAKMQEFMQQAQALDNARLSQIGVDNGGVYEKKAHLLGSEQEMNKSTSSSPMIDAIESRTNFCKIANKIWGLKMSYDKEDNDYAEDVQYEETESNLQQSRRVEE